MPRSTCNQTLSLLDAHLTLNGLGQDKKKSGHDDMPESALHKDMALVWELISVHWIDTIAFCEKASN